MRSYIINLEHSKERLDDMISQFSSHNAEYERVIAINGKNYKGAYLGNAHCQIMDIPLTANEIACFLSHRLCWEKIAQGSDSHGAVFEDDVVISADAWNILESTPLWLTDVDLLKIETFLTQVYFSRKVRRISSKRVMLQAKSFHSGSAGYILSKKAAIELLEKTASFLPCAVDNFLFDTRFYAKNNTKIYHLSPALCIQTCLIGHKKGHESTIDAQDSVPRMQYQLKKKTGIRRILQNFTQPARRIYYKKTFIPFDAI